MTTTRVDSVYSTRGNKLNKYFASSHVGPIKIQHLVFCTFSIKIHRSYTNAAVNNQNKDKLGICFNKRDEASNAQTSSETWYPWSVHMKRSDQTTFSWYQFSQDKCHILEQWQQGPCNNMDKYIIKHILKATFYIKMHSNVG